MTVFDQLQDLESRVVTRLRELHPLVAEYRDLEKVARRLGINVGEPGSPKPASRSRGKRPSGSGRARSRKSTSRRAATPPGQRQAQLLEVIRKQPGITVREAGKAMKVDPTSLYRIVRRLEADGVVKKDGTALT